jgi:hypothetical protein
MIPLIVSLVSISHELERGIDVRVSGVGTIIGDGAYSIEFAWKGIEIAEDDLEARKMTLGNF